MASGSAPQPAQADPHAELMRLLLFSLLREGNSAGAGAALSLGADAGAVVQCREEEPPWWGCDWDEDDPPPTYPKDYRMLTAAAFGGCAEMVPRLVAAGHPVELEDINIAVESGSLDTLAALLQAAPRPLPAVPPPSGYKWLDAERCCPLLNVLRCARRNGRRRSAAMAELLLEAGYRPAVFNEQFKVVLGDEVYTLEEKDFCPAKVWGLGLNAIKASGKYSKSIDLLGDTVVHSADLPEGSRNRWLWDFIQLLIAHPAWTPANHSAMPAAFKAAARTFLLAAHRSPPAIDHSRPNTRRQAAANRQVNWLPVLPQPVLLKIVSLAARPLSAWVE